MPRSTSQPSNAGVPPAGAAASRAAAPQIREATLDDVPTLAAMRAQEWGTIDYWHQRIAGYMTRELNPQQALAPRVVFVAESAFIAGHLTRRFDCDGEVQWLNVAPEARRKGIASELLRHLANWFVERDAKRICVDVDPDNAAGRAFYLRHGAAPLNPHWLVWDDVARLARQIR